MDQVDIKASHSTYGPGSSNPNLCNESGDRNKNSVNVLDKKAKYKRSSENQISSSKPQKLMKDEEYEIDMVADALDQEQSADIYKLPVELLAYIFDYLTLKDLCAIRQTSKWFDSIAGICFQKNYSAVVRCFSIDIENGLKLNAFHQLIQTIDIMGSGSKYNEFEYYFNRQSEFKQLKTMRITSVHDLEGLKLEEMREMLDKVEYLEIYRCTTSKIFTEKIPILFPNLNRLTMHSLFHERDDGVIDNHYPKLERFDINAMQTETVALGSFLERNPNIHKLAMDIKCLWNHRESIKAAKMEDLAIKITDFYFVKNFASFYQLLNELHESESYQRLKCTTSRILYMRDKWIELASLPALVGLTIGGCMDIRFALSIFQNLEEICIERSYLINDIEAMADNLVNLERIRFGYADLDDIMTLIKRARNVSKIKVTKFIRAASCGISKTTERLIYARPGRENNRCFEEQEQKVINLSSLNTERAQLSDAKMITLYVTEEVYLTTKRVMNETDYDFIQLRRFESFKWDHDFHEMLVFTSSGPGSIFEPPSR